MQHHGSDENKDVSEPAEFDPFAPSPRSTPNLRQERLRKRRRYVRMVSSLALTIALFLVLWLVMDMWVLDAVLIPIVAIHMIMWFAELLLDERSEPEYEKRSWLDIYARWFGFRDW